MIKEMFFNEYGDGVSWYRGSMLGKGSFGYVYLATLKNPKSKYSYYPPLMAVKSAEVSDSVSIQKEKEVLSNVQGSRDIIGCFGEETTIGNNGMMVYNLLLEYGSGGSLADRIKNSGCHGLPEYEARVYARCLLRGLCHIHSIGYVHCDMKPDNILLVPISRKGGGCSEFRAIIADFGLAKREKQSKKRKLEEPYWRGTPMYLSPEAVMECVQEAPCDIWALGCIVLEMLTGKAPRDEKNKLSAEEILGKIGEKGKLPKIPNGISKEAKAFLKGCFVRNTTFRLTAEMLLKHPFVEGLKDDENEDEEFESDDELRCDVFSDESDIGSEEDSFSDFSEECTDDEVILEFGEEGVLLGGCDRIGAIQKNDTHILKNVEATAGSIIADGFDQSKEMEISSTYFPKSKRHCPVRFAVLAV